MRSLVVPKSGLVSCVILVANLTLGIGVFGGWRLALMPLELLLFSPIKPFYFPDIGRSTGYPTSTFKEWAKIFNGELQNYSVQKGLQQVASSEKPRLSKSISLNQTRNYAKWTRNNSKSFRCCWIQCTTVDVFKWSCSFRNRWCCNWWVGKCKFGTEKCILRWWETSWPGSCNVLNAGSSYMYDPVKM